MINLFCGFDQRESAGFFVFMASVLAHTRSPVVMRRMDAMALPRGSNAFSFSRFLVPALMGFRGRAIFADASDMLALGDIADLEEHFDSRKAVHVVKHRYKTRHPVKYIGTTMECPNLDYPRKNWASLMLMNCGHPAWQRMNSERIEAMAATPTHLLGLQWLEDEEIGTLPEEWNRLVDEGQPVEGAKLLHFTAGLPCFEHYEDTPGADLWRAEMQRMLEGQQMSQGPTE